MRIHLLTTRQSRRAHAFSYPLRVFRHQLRHAGLDVRFFYKADHPALTRCDVLGVVSDHFGIDHLIQRPDDVVRLLENYRSDVRALLWFDVTDGTGTLFEPAFAAVDVYAKKQCLKDRRLYRTAFYEREYHLHYFYERYGDALEAYGEKARVVNHRGLEDWESEKISLSWNIGLGDYNTFWGRGRQLRPYWPVARFTSRSREANNTDRPIGVSYRVGTQYHFPAVPFHRLQLRRLLEEVAQGRKEDDIIYEGRLPYRAYLKELGQTRIAPSPFGWGAICWRDFEVFLSGALLLKPAMDHLDTWPAYYEKDVTYIAHRWDFSDFKKTVTTLLDHPDQCQVVARAGQERYLASLSPQGGEAFVQRVIGLVQEGVQQRQSLR